MRSAQGTSAAREAATHCVGWLHPARSSPRERPQRRVRPLAFFSSSLRPTGQLTDETCCSATCDNISSRHAPQDDSAEFGDVQGALLWLPLPRQRMISSRTSLRADKSPPLYRLHKSRHKAGMPPEAGDITATSINKWRFNIRTHPQHQAQQIKSAGLSRIKHDRPHRASTPICAKH